MHAPNTCGVTSEVMTRDTVERPRRGRNPAVGPPSGRVRIIGAERAGDSAGAGPDGETGVEPGEAPASFPGDGDLAGAERGTEGGDRRGDDEAWSAEDWSAEDWSAEAWTAEDGAGDQWPEEPAAWMPHWTEAPTGEVPAVLARGDEGARHAAPEPSWREEAGDWDLDTGLSPSILDDEDTGSIAEGSPSDRQPWSFELDEDVGPEGTAGPTGRGASEAVGAAGAGEPDGPDSPDLFSPWTETAQHPATRADEPAHDEPPREERGGGGAAIGAEHAAPAHATGWDPDEVGGEKTTVVPAVGKRERGTIAGDEAAALASDLESHGLRRAWERRRPEAVRGGTARHRARSAPAPAREDGARAKGEGAAPTRSGRNLPAAIGSGIVVGALVLLAFHFGTVPSMVVVTAVILLAAAEAYAALRRAGQHPATFLGLAAVGAVLVGTYDRAFQALPVVLVLLVVFTFLWHLFKVDPRADPLRSTAVTVLVFCWVGVFGSFAALLLSPSLFPDRHGIAYLLGALIATVAYDVGALAAGSWLGRHPLSGVSPSKTWEGAVGGAVAAVVLSVAVVRLIHPWTLAETIALGVVVAVVSPVGDLCESLVKRHLGVKDMGRLLPGHGGVLDRVDGMLFVLPATYYLLRAFGHG